MELFNTIKTLLTSPDPTLVAIILFVAAIIEALLIQLTIVQLSGKKLSYKNTIIFVIVFTLTSMTSLALIPAPYNILVNYIIFYALTHTMFKFTYLETLVNLVISSSICLLISFVVLNIFVSTSGISYEQLSIIPIYRIYFLILTYTIYFITLKLLGLFKLTLTFKSNLIFKNKLLLFSNFTVALLVLIFQVLCIFKNYHDNVGYTNSFFIFLSLLIYVGLNILTLIKILQLHTTSEKLENAESYNKALTVLHDNVRGFKHDFDNLIATIGGFVDTEDISGLKDFYKDIALDCRKTNNLYALNPKIINNPGIYNLLINKYDTIESKDIKLNLNIQLDFNNLKIKTYHLSRILGILIDNAIEGTQDCNEKIINLEFRTSHRARKYIISIENTYSNSNIDTKSIFLKGYSEKEDHSGIGLWEVNNFLKHYSNITLITSNNEKLFSQELSFYDYE